jgi:hypothetical protein
MNKFRKGHIPIVLPRREGGADPQVPGLRPIPRRWEGAISRSAFTTGEGGRVDEPIRAERPAQPCLDGACILDVGTNVL